MAATNVKHLAVYLDPETYEQVQKLAEAEERSMSNFAARVIKKGLEKRKTAQGQKEA